METKKRADCFFGLHFDFHADEDSKGIGTKTTAENIGKLLDEVKPDFVQVDTKGHPGWASYQSDYAPVAPGLEVDHLKIIREETKKRGIALFAHYSGIFDRQACKRHPEWAVLHKNNNLDQAATSTMSKYADEELIPCLCELGEKYGLDGAWVDGECWAVETSWRKEETDAFLKESGYERVDPDDPTSDAYIAYVDFWKNNFKKYLKHYMSEVHKRCPNFQMTSNFAFSQQMPEKPIDEIDFLSGDTVGSEGRLCIRSFAGLGKPWDAMSYGQSGMYVTEGAAFAPYTTRNIERVCRDASMTLSQGGGYQFFNNMTRSGEIRMYDLERLKTLSAYVYARKQFNYKSVPMKNAAVLISAYNNSRRRIEEEPHYASLYGLAANGICDVIVDAGLPCDIIYDFQLKNPERSTVIIPDNIYYLSDETIADLKRFTENGGNLIVCGTKTCKLLADMIDADIKDFDSFVVYAQSNGSMFGTHNAILFDKKGSTDVIDCFYDELSSDGPKTSLVVTNPYGKGKVVFVGFNIMDEYTQHNYFELPEIMRRVLFFADSEQNAYLESGTPRVEVVPAEKDGKMLINIINTTESYYDVNESAAGVIIPIYDLVIAAKCRRKPAKVMLEPEHTEAEYTYDGKYAHIKVDKLHIHRIITIE